MYQTFAKRWWYKYEYNKFCTHEAYDPEVHDLKILYIPPFMILSGLLQMSERVWWEKLERKVRYLREFAKNINSLCQSFTESPRELETDYLAKRELCLPPGVSLSLNIFSWIA